MCKSYFWERSLVDIQRYLCEGNSVKRTDYLFPFFKRDVNTTHEPPNELLLLSNSSWVFSLFGHVSCKKCSLEHPCLLHEKNERSARTIKQREESSCFPCRVNLWPITRHHLWGSLGFYLYDCCFRYNENCSARTKVWNDLNDLERLLCKQWKTTRVTNFVLPSLRCHKNNWVASCRQSIKEPREASSSSFWFVMVSSFPSGTTTRIPHMTHNMIDQLEVSWCVIVSFEGHNLYTSNSLTYSCKVVVRYAERETITSKIASGFYTDSPLLVLQLLI